MPEDDSLKQESQPTADAQPQNTPAQPIDESLDRRTIFVRSIPESATNEQLSEFFSQFVPVRHAVIVYDEEKKSRGFGFVSFTMDDDTLTALVEAKKNKFQGRFLRVDIAKRRDRKAAKAARLEDERREENGEIVEKKAKKPVHEPVEKRKPRLIVRNLPWSVKTGEMLKKHFVKFGGVHDAYVVTKKGGQLRGFGFVVMNKLLAAERAVKQSAGMKIDGREVAVDLAVAKAEWEKEVLKEPKEIKPSIARERKAPEKSEADDEDSDGDDIDDDENDFDKLNEVNSDDDDDDDDEDMQDNEEEEEEKLKRPKLNKQEAFSVFVRNIPYDADEESLKEHFSQFGAVKYALPVMDRVTGVAKGSAFVAFKTAEAYECCLADAPTVSATSMLISDDVAPEYVYQGRILSIASTVDRSSASKLAERNSEKRGQAYGKESGDKDKRNLYLLNEGRITENSRLAEFISKTDMELREKSYKMRVQQLNKNPSLHLSLTRLAIRNLPRAMNSKLLKALGRKAVVEFATEVKNNLRQPLSKEEVNRSIKLKHELEGEKPLDEEEREKEKKKNKKMGVVKQAKVIMEVKGSGDIGRSRGYGFIEFRDHKTALMGLRWLNAHEVTIDEITEGMSEEERKLADFEGINKRKLIVEFAIENAKVVKRRRELVMVARHGKRKRDGDDDEEEMDEEADAKLAKKQKKSKGPSRKGNMKKGPKTLETGKSETGKSSAGEDSSKPAAESTAENVKHIIARKRKGKKGKN